MALAVGSDKDLKAASRRGNEMDLNSRPNSSSLCGWLHFKFCRVKASPPREEQGPRRNEDDLSVSTRISNEVDSAVESDVRRVKFRAKVMVAVLVLGLLVATIVDLACHDNVRNFLGETFEWIECNPRSGEWRYMYSGILTV